MNQPPITAQAVEIDTTERRVTIDGQLLPWAIAEHTATAGSGELSTVTLTLVVNGPVHIH